MPLNVSITCEILCLDRNEITLSGQPLRLIKRFKLFFSEFADTLDIKSRIIFLVEAHAYNVTQALCILLFALS